jgi:tRNA threonylcarbamoyladenosine biosynthesis protein TsaB
MIVLGIETSTAVCSVGLANELDLRVERSLVESHIHSEKLLTLIQEVCQNQQLSLQQLDGIAISIGPGSFTGLRIGLSTAKGLCYSLGKPILDVPTFEAIASTVFLSHSEYKRVMICIDAKQGEYYIGIYEKVGRTLCQVFPVKIGNLSSTLSEVYKGTIIVTDRIDEVKKIFNGSMIVESVLPYCRGDIIAGMAIEKLKAGQKNAQMNLEPMYLKDFIVQARMK